MDEGKVLVRPAFLLSVDVEGHEDAMSCLELAQECLMPSSFHVYMRYARR